MCKMTFTNVDLSKLEQKLIRDFSDAEGFTIHDVLESIKAHLFQMYKEPAE